MFAAMPPCPPCLPADESSGDEEQSGASRAARGRAPPSRELPADFIKQRMEANPRDSPEGGGNVEYP
jgi:hypothetical protein